ncbi:MAG: matrixin family metalloprotease [Myxococcales bacterium]|nr:matrixin family metalloprotease [Polyangiaceae bacterium]MDW8251460.1 matrixin family metalloprotease [Myxococcales bacterium]
MQLVVLLLLVLSVPGEARAFCRSTTCIPKSAGDCELDEQGCRTKGKPFFWSSGCVGFSLHERGSNNISQGEIERTFHAALRAWSVVSCSGQPASFAYGRQENVVCEVGHDPRGPNANVILFRDNGWPYQGASNTLGYTTVTFESSTGRILGADIEVNSGQNIITTEDRGVRYDLESILVHELGHALGLSHSNNPEATMRASYAEGSTDMRTLAPDDLEAVCTVYPPWREATCDLTPSGGFTDCRNKMPPPRAPELPSCSHPPGPPGVAMPQLLLPLVLLALRRSLRRS